MRPRTNSMSAGQGSLGHPLPQSNCVLEGIGQEGLVIYITREGRVRPPHDTSPLTTKFCVVQGGDQNKTTKEGPSGSGLLLMATNCAHIWQLLVPKDHEGKNPWFTPNPLRLISRSQLSPVISTFTSPFPLP